tara:strand:+ start:73085 stop:73774 length:690 start_codon:yes stop_codon:yes gene_type:complete
VKRIVTIRPAPGDRATVERAAHQGLKVETYPLFSAGPVPWSVPEPVDFDAVLLGSANALRHGGAGLAALTGLPALCVGQTTAMAAEHAGFDVVATGARGMQSLLPHAKARQMNRLLRLSGEAHVPLDLPEGIAVDTRITYTVSAHPIDAELAEMLADGALILLHSGQAARHFAQECGRLGLEKDRIALACLAPRIADMAGTGWADCHHASSPDDSALLELARQMCQGGL